VALFIGQADVERLFATRHVGMLDCIEAVESAFREHGDARVGLVPRQVLTADGGPPRPRGRALKLSASYMRDSEVMGASVYSTHYRPGDVDMWLMMFSGRTGDLAGILHGKALSLWKTGATAAVAARHLARKDARRAAIIGTGHYATTQLLGLAAVRSLESVACFSRDPDRLRDFVARAASLVPEARVVAADSARAAVEGADLVATITTSPVPVVKGQWLARGAHCGAMGQHAPTARELDTEAIVRARVVVDAREQAFEEKGEILVPLAAGDIERSHVVAELGEVVAGRVPGRLRDDDLTVFCSGGTALEYMRLCTLLIDRARAAGLGRELDPQVATGAMR
jgi:alanine dehydrogenase